MRALVSHCRHFVQLRFVGVKCQRGKDRCLQGFLGNEGGHLRPKKHHGTQRNTSERTQFTYALLRGNVVSQTVPLRSTTKEGETCRCHNSSRDSQANMSLTDVLFLLLLLFVLILKA